MRVAARGGEGMGVQRQRLARRRKALGYSQEQLAERLGVERSTVVRWERGTTDPQPWVRPKILRALQLSTEELDELLAYDGRAEQVPDATLPGLLISGLSTTSEPRAWEPRDVSVQGIELLLQRLYRLDDEFGGDGLHETIAGYVRAGVGLFTKSLPAAQEQRLRRAVAGLTQIAGWLSIDANRHADAHRYLTATLHAAHEADDLALSGHVLGYMSLHALYRGRLREALTAAETAADIGRAWATPRTTAILHCRAARTHARLGNARACKSQLDLADASAAEPAGDHKEPDWIAYVDDIELFAQRGACLLDLGEAGSAAAVLRETISLVETTDPGRIRDLAHYKTRLASAYLGQAEPAQAVAVAEQAHALSMHIGSSRVKERFGELMCHLAEYNLPEVRSLAERVRAASN